MSFPETKSGLDIDVQSKCEKKNIYLKKPGIHTETL